MTSAFPSGKRLDQAGVLAVLKQGKRLNRTEFELKFLNSSAAAFACHGQIAISVPKRLVKSSVARNRIRRIVREEFRVHPVAEVPLQMLVNYKGRNDARRSAVRRLLRQELANLFNHAMRSLKASHTAVRAS